MRVEMDRQADFGFQRFDQYFGCIRLEHAGHVFQAQNMGTGRFQLLAHSNIVFQVVLRSVRIKNVAGIANGTFANLTVLNHRIHRDTHVFNPVQAIKHAENIDTLGRGHADEFLHHIVRIIGIAHAIRPAQQHLRHHVWQGSA